MQIKCEYCGHYIDDADAFCGNCGAPNDNMMRSANGGGVVDRMTAVFAFDLHGSLLGRLSAAGGRFIFSY